MSGFFAFILNLSKPDNILFRSMPNGNCLFRSASLSLLAEDNSLVHDLRVMAAVELHVKTTYHNRQNQFMKKANQYWMVIYFPPWI